MGTVLTELEAVHKMARALARRASRARGEAWRPDLVPALVLMSDPVRAPDLAALAGRAPKGAWLLARSFGAAPDLSGVRAGLSVLATVPPRLARQQGLAGVHWPARRLGLRQRSAVGGLFETASAHSAREALLAARQGITVLLVSAVFASASPSAGRPLGPVRLARLIRAVTAAAPKVAVLALGGVNATRVRRLAGTGASGVAGVSFA
jgi:thiamine-phosphate pyrophosphorylase